MQARKNIKVTIKKRKTGEIIAGTIRGYDGLADLWPIETEDGTRYGSALDEIIVWEAEQTIEEMEATLERLMAQRARLLAYADEAPQGAAQVKALDDAAKLNARIDELDLAIDAAIVSEM